MQINLPYCLTGVPTSVYQGEYQGKESIELFVLEVETSSYYDSYRIPKFESNFCIPYKVQLNKALVVDCS